jgi:hypothetical protein
MDKEIVDLAKNPEHVNELHDGAIVCIGDVHLRFSFDSLKPDAATNPKAFVFMTTLDSDMDGYEKDCDRIRAEHKAQYPDVETEPYSVETILGYGCNYGEFIKNFRASENGAAMMTREEMITTLKSGVFVIC